jgi:hypothetical protein
MKKILLVISIMTLGKKAVLPKQKCNLSLMVWMRRLNAMYILVKRRQVAARQLVAVVVGVIK